MWQKELFGLSVLKWCVLFACVAVSAGVNYLFDISDITALEYVRRIYVASPLALMALLLWVRENDKRRKAQFDLLQRQIDIQRDQIRQLDKELLAINVHPRG
jgi:hypothetical protein